MRRRKNAGPLDVARLDKSQSFLMGRIIIYLDRLLEHHRRLDQEKLEAVHWALGPRMIEEDLLPLVQTLDPGKGRRRDRKAAEGIHDSSAFADYFEDALKQGPASDEVSSLGLIRDLLKKRLNQLDYQGNSDIEKNLARFQRMFGLNDLEAEICLFLTLVETYEEAESLFEYHLKCDRYAGRVHLKTILNCTNSELTRALNGRLTKVGVLEAHPNRSTEVRIEAEFVQLLLGSDETEMQTTYFKRIRPNPLPLDSHAIDSEMVQHAMRLLSPSNETGCALLLFGNPGVGKTTLAYGLCKEAGLDIFLCRHEGKSREWERRMSIMSTVYAASENKNSVVIIDDCDAIVGTEHLWSLFGNYDDKKWLHDLLESNAKMIFIVNETHFIEESVMRRFSFSIAFKEFNRNQRIQLWRNILERHQIRDAFTGREIENLSSRFVVSPGLIEQAVAQAVVGDRLSGSTLSRSISLALEAHERLRHGKRSGSHRQTFDKNFTVEGLNVSGADLNELLDELEQFNRYLTHSGRDENMNMAILLHGFSGTGKTYFARYVAHRLDKELLVKRGSDLLDKYIGETEKRIRSAYEEAEAKDAVLLIDEADSLLFNRDRAVRSWEISFTNEFLNSMESFTGIQIFTTNRFEDLDVATLRRFAFKLGFDYLIFYKTILAPLVPNPLQKKLEQKIRNIESLTPGDFTAVKTRFRFKSIDKVTHAALVNALVEESRAKKAHNGSRAIGF
ncbi:AAA family ATPase [Thermodesulfobacteriota bacterium]